MLYQRDVSIFLINSTVPNVVFGLCQCNTYRLMTHSNVTRIMGWACWKGLDRHRFDIVGVDLHGMMMTRWPAIWFHAPPLPPSLPPCWSHTERLTAVCSKRSGTSESSQVCRASPLQQVSPAVFFAGGGIWWWAPTGPRRRGKYVSCYPQCGSTIRRLSAQPQDDTRRHTTLGTPELLFFYVVLRQLRASALLICSQVIPIARAIIVITYVMQMNAKLFFINGRTMWAIMRNVLFLIIISTTFKANGSFN